MHIAYWFSLLWVLMAFCVCGRSFPNEGARSVHQRTCTRAVSGYGNMLKRRREAVEEQKSRKRRRDIEAAAALAQPQECEPVIVQVSRFCEFL